MTETEIAAMVSDCYWSELPSGQESFDMNSAVEIVAEYAHVDRAEACRLLLETSPSHRAQRRDEHGRWTV